MNADFGSKTRHALVLFAAATLLAGCNLEDSATTETRARLVGTWLAEPEAGSPGARRLLSLHPDGNFTDEVSDPAPGNPGGRRELAGEWSYDGVNLKRRYLQENGRKYSGGGMRYATFPLKAVTPTELVLEDTIQKRQAKFRRVEKAAGG